MTAVEKLCKWKLWKVKIVKYGNGAKWILCKMEIVEMENVVNGNSGIWKLGDIEIEENRHSGK